MNPELTHRIVRDNDAPAMFELLMHPSVNYQMAFDPVPLDAFHDIFDSIRARGEMFVVELDDRIVGTYRIERGRFRMARQAHLAAFAVHPDCRRTGIGREMVRTIVDRLQSAGVVRLDLTVAEDNATAISFWSSVGFRIEARMRRYFTRAPSDVLKDELQMVRFLDEVLPSELAARPVSVTNAEHYRWGDGCDGWQLVDAPMLSVIEEHMPPSTAEVPHYHRLSRQFFRVLKGRLHIEIDGKVHVLQAGDGLEIPPGVTHHVRCPADGPADFLVISQPPSHGDRHAPPQQPSSK